MPILRDREMLQPASVPGRDEPVTLMNAGFVADQDGPSVRTGIPELGGDTDSVLQQLGYSEAEIAQLRNSGAI
jgi:crotonobetainyl-CoA:carnitine CoA-transferase CaiB-like acyl-CoA transferase